MILQLANHCNIALNQEMLLLIHPLGGFKHYEFLNAYKYKRLEIRGAYTSFAIATELELMKGCGNGSISLFKVMLQLVS